MQILTQQADVVPNLCIPHKLAEEAVSPVTTLWVSRRERLPALSLHLHFPTKQRREEVGMLLAVQTREGVSSIIQIGHDATKSLLSSSSVLTAVKILCASL